MCVMVSNEHGFEALQESIEQLTQQLPHDSLSQENPGNTITNRRGFAQY